MPSLPPESRFCRLHGRVHSRLCRNNQSLAVLRPSSGIGTDYDNDCTWIVKKSGVKLVDAGVDAARAVSVSSLEATGLPGMCLAATSTFWPVPVGRNYVVQLQDCGGGSTPPPEQQWVVPGTSNGTGFIMSNAPMPSGGRCLDAAVSPPPPSAPPAKCCDNATAKALPYCSGSLSHAERAADLVSRLTVEEMSGALTMNLMNSETPAGTTKVRARAYVCVRV